MNFDCVIIGAGISGAAAGYELAEGLSVALIETETAPGYHSTGRSAALFTPNYGGSLVRKINQASRVFFEAPPAGFTEHPLLTPRGGLTIATPGEDHRLPNILAMSSPGQEIYAISASEAIDRAPLLRRERVAAALYEPGVTDIDVSALHQGFLRGFKRRGGRLICGQPVTALQRSGDGWDVSVANSTIRARIVVNAAGAWAGHVGDMACATNINLVAKRRTAIVVDAPEGMDVASMPTVDFAGIGAYFKPDAGRIMASPGDETPMEPQDVQPDEWDVAVLADWLQTETKISIKRIAHSWAGLRSFVADEAPVVGFDPVMPNFFWLAGQGGYGIMMAPALGRAAAGLILNGTLPADLVEVGVSAEELQPGRPVASAQALF